MPGRRKQLGDYGERHGIVVNREDPHGNYCNGIAYTDRRAIPYAGGGRPRIEAAQRRCQNATSQTVGRRADIPRP